MRNFIIRRLILIIPLFLGVSILSFTIVSLSPIDIVDLQTQGGANISPDNKQRQKEKLHFVTRPETFFHAENAEVTVEAGWSPGFPRIRKSYYDESLAFLRFNEEPLQDDSATAGNTVDHTAALNGSVTASMENSTSLNSLNSVNINYDAWDVTDELTIMFWMNWSGSGANQGTLFSQGTNLRAEISRPLATITNGTENSSMLTVTISDSSYMFNISLTTDAWHHYSVVFRAGELSVYLDGRSTGRIIMGQKNVPLAQSGLFKFGESMLEAAADELYILRKAVSYSEVASWANNPQELGAENFTTGNFQTLPEADVDATSRQDDDVLTTTVTEAGNYAWQIISIDYTGIVEEEPAWDFHIPVLVLYTAVRGQALGADPSLSGVETFVWSGALNGWTTFGLPQDDESVLENSIRLPPLRGHWREYLTALGEVSILVRSRSPATATTSLQLELDLAKIGIVLTYDTPIYEQFVYWLINFLTGEDYSYLYRSSSIDVISIFAWETIKLQFAALILSLLIAVPVGVISATRQYSKMDNLAMTGALLGVSLPVFWTGLMLILIFAFYIPIFPSSLAYTQLVEPDFPWYGTWSFDAAWHMVLPTIILGTAGAALTTRLVRSSMLEVLRQDYIMTARSKGLTERLVVYKHALRNALLPVVTIIGLSLGGMLGGAALTETVFNWPGLGKTAVTATIQRDYYLVLGINVVLSMIMIMANLLTDVSYAFLDPRIRY